MEYWSIGVMGGSGTQYSITPTLQYSNQSEQERHMSNYQTILYQKQRNGVLITLNRPNALNAMNQDMMNDLDAGLAEAEGDQEIRAVVITGAGAAFSAGEDISGADPDTAWPYGIPSGT